MKASVQWLRKLVPQLQDTPAAIAARLTFAGLEVEGLVDYGVASESCIVARVVSTRPHPTKSGLKLVTVDRGGGTQEVICGAPNVPEPGGLVVLAPLGTHLPAKDLTIGKRDIGGVPSEGMLCSEAELGLSEASGGILVLPAGSGEPGQPLSQAVPQARDTIIEINLLANRPDALGHIGLARELCALYKYPFALPELAAPLATVEGSPKSVGVDIVVREAQRCPHYGAALMFDVTVGPSPIYVQCLLNALGVRPISNLVDVTNFMMLKYGQPMHAFDVEKVRGGQLTVRLARDGEKLVTLEGIERALMADDLVIADGEGPIALAGVIGGKRTEIDSGTKRALFECAYFEPRGVRRASRRYGIHTESSHRFERGIDRGGARRVLARALAITSQWSPGSKAGREAIHVEPKPPQRAHVSLRQTRLDAVLGVSSPLAEARDVLERLGCEVTDAKAPATLDVSVPLHRPDLTREIDLIEEVMRVRGIELVPAVLPRVHATRDVGGREELARRARAAAVGQGLSEAVTYAFTSPVALEKARAQPASVVLQNPLTVHQSVMRTSLLPTLLDVVDRARRHGESQARLFTLGSTYVADPSHKPGHDLPQEGFGLLALLAGERAGYLTKAAPYDVWDATGVAEGLVRDLTGLAPTFAPAPDVAHLHPRGAAHILVEKLGQPTVVGLVGPLHPDVRDAYDLAGDVMVVELSLEALPAPVVPKFAELPRFPAVERDLALVMKDDVPAGDVLTALFGEGKPLAEAVRLFDRFVGGSIPAGHASVAFRVVYRAPDRTLTDDEVERVHAKVVAVANERFGASLRS